MQQALDRHLPGGTCLIVSHKVSSGPPLRLDRGPQTRTGSLSRARPHDLLHLRGYYATMVSPANSGSVAGSKVTTVTSTVIAFRFGALHVDPSRVSIYIMPHQFGMKNFSRKSISYNCLALGCRIR